jgi:sulfate transport system ATP-binding protein
MSSAIVVEHLTKRFGSYLAVDDVSFTARPGEITALLGPSGSGKSTVLRMIAGLERPDSGRIAIGARELTTTAARERRVGMVFQHYALFRHMTVAANVAFGLKVRKVPAAERTRRVDELLALVGLSAFADRYPEQLSGGQRQRVALARALAPAPEVLLLDEPFGALDARVRQELRAWLHDLHARLHITSLLVTHDQDEALELADQVIVMHEGRVEQAGSPADVYERPATPFVAGFIGAANVLRGFVIGGRLQLGDHHIAGAEGLPDGQVAYAYVRPHDVRIARSPSPGALEATVVRASDLGWTKKVVLDAGGGQRISAQVPGGLDDIAPGTTVWLELGALRLFAPEGEAPASDELAAL